MYYAYKVLRNYQIRPFMLRLCVKPADYYLGPEVEEEQFRTSTPIAATDGWGPGGDFDRTLVDNVLATKKKRRRQ